MPTIEEILKKVWDVYVVTRDVKKALEVLDRELQKL